MRFLKQIRYKLKYMARDLLFWYAGMDGPIYRWFTFTRYKPDAESVEAFMDVFSQSKKDFYLVQVGANDGMTHDPVYKFIKRDHWHAILFEPQPAVFNRYLKPVYRNYPRVNPVNAAIGYEDGNAALYTIAFNQDRWATGLSTFERTVLETTIEEGRLDKRLKRYGITPPEGIDDWIAPIEIAVRSFASTMLEHEINRIDLLMIDTEGFDHEVIKMVDLNAVKPSAIVFEDTHIAPHEYRSCMERLEEFGYESHRIGPNTVAWQADIGQFIPWR